MAPPAYSVLQTRAAKPFILTGRSLEDDNCGAFGNQTPNDARFTERFLMKILSCAYFRRTIYISVLIARAFAQTGSRTVAPVDAAVTYQINATHNGRVQTKGLYPPLAVKWSVNLNATVGYPLIAEDKVFVLAGDSNAGTVNLYALHAATGKKIWGPVLIPEGAYWWAAAAYDKGVVYVVPDSTPGFSSGAMFAYSAKTGKLIWTATLPEQYLYSSPPTAGNGMVYTGGAGEGGTVYAVREKNGSVAWTNGVENGDNSSPVVTRNGVYVSYACPQTYRFHPYSGVQAWNYSGGCEGGGGATMALYRGLLYVRNTYNYSTNSILLDAANGDMVGGFNTTFIPAFLNGTAFYTGSNAITAVNIKTGNTIWSAAPPNGDSYASPPIVVNSTVYVGTVAGNLLAYKGSDGTVLASVVVGASISASDGEGFGSPLAGLSAAQGMIVVPASTYVVAIKHSK
jgi:outer membrane protein assembly factor BamB